MLRNHKYIHAIYWIIRIFYASMLLTGLGIFPRALGNTFAQNVLWQNVLPWGCFGYGVRSTWKESNRLSHSYANIKILDRIDEYLILAPGRDYCYRRPLMTYPPPFHLCCQHNHHRRALLPRHLPEVGASVGQRALARYVAVYQTGSRNLHLFRMRERERERTDEVMLDHDPHTHFLSSWNTCFVCVVSTQ